MAFLEIADSYGKPRSSGAFMNTSEEIRRCSEQKSPVAPPYSCFFYCGTSGGESAGTQAIEIRMPALMGSS